MHEKTLPIPQKGQGIPAKVSRGHPFIDSIPTSVNRNSEGEKYTLNNPVISRTRIVRMVLCASGGEAG
jgi:hypothetical protein